ncbi:hypothetical protein BaRGS_00026397, partial [Batillaria attramentaria]
IAIPNLRPLPETTKDAPLSAAAPDPQAMYGVTPITHLTQCKGDNSALYATSGVVPVKSVYVYRGWDTLASNSIPATGILKGRLEVAGNGSVTLTDLRPEDAGLYTIEVIKEDSTKIFALTAVHLAEPPATNDGIMGRLHVQRVSLPGNQGTVRLTCGRFTNLGFPPADVIWQDPEGRVLASTGQAGGVFHVDLAPGSPTGNYSCLLYCGASLSCCLPPHSPLLQHAQIHVDSTTTPNVERAMTKTGQDMAVAMAAVVSDLLQEKLEDRMNDTLTDLGMVLADQNQRSRDAVDEKFEDWKTEFRQMYTEELVDFQARLEERTYGNLSQVQASLELVKQELDATQGLFRMDDNSILAFRLTAGTDSSAYGRYTSVGYNDDHPMVHAGWNCGCRSVDGILPCNRHYRSRFLDLWPSSLIDTVKVTVYEHGKEMAYVEFNGRGSTYLDWFSPDRVVSSSWTDLLSEPHNYFSIAGYSQSSPRISRSFFINRNYNGCPGDRGWLVVVDYAPDVCSWGQGSPTPIILYSRLSTESTI